MLSLSSGINAQAEPESKKNDDFAIQYNTINLENFLENFSSGADVNFYQRTEPDTDVPDQINTFQGLELTEFWKYGTYSFRPEDNSTMIKNYSESWKNLVNIKGSGHLGLLFGSPHNNFIYTNIFGTRVDTWNRFWGSEAIGQFKPFFVKGFYDKDWENKRTVTETTTPNELIGDINVEQVTRDNFITKEKGVNFNFRPKKTKVDLSYEESVREDLQTKKITTRTSMGTDVTDVPETKYVDNTKIYSADIARIFSNTDLIGLSGMHIQNSSESFGDPPGIINDNRSLIGAEWAGLESGVKTIWEYMHINNTWNPNFMVFNSYKQNDFLMSAFGTYAKEKKDFAGTIWLSFGTNDVDDMQRGVLAEENYLLMNELENKSRTISRMHDYNKEMYDFESSRLFSSFDISKFVTRLHFSVSEDNMNGEAFMKYTHKYFAAGLTVGGEVTSNNRLHQYINYSTGVNFKNFYLIFDAQDDNFSDTNIYTIGLGFKN